MPTEDCCMCSGVGYYGNDTCAACRGSGYQEVSEFELRDRANRAKTENLSNDEIINRIRQREREGKPTGQLRAAARQRGIKL